MSNESILDNDVFEDTGSATAGLTTFQITQEGWLRMRNALIKRLLLIMPIMIAFTMGVSYYQNGAMGLDVYMLTPIVFFIVLMIVTLYYNVRRQRTATFSLRIYITDSTVTREHINATALTIKKEDITKIEYHPAQYSYLVYGKTQFDVIAIPEEVNDANLLRPLLNALHNEPIIEKSSTIRMALLYGAIPLTLGGIAGIQFSDNKLIVAISAIVLIGPMLYSIINVQRNPNVPTKTKVLFLLVLIPMLSFMYIAYHKLFL